MCHLSLQHIIRIVSNKLEPAASVYTLDLVKDNMMAVIIPEGCARLFSEGFMRGSVLHVRVCFTGQKRWRLICINAYVNTVCAVVMHARACERQLMFLIQ
jgi:hypothetical protein